MQAVIGTDPIEGGALKSGGVAIVSLPHAGYSPVRTKQVFCKLTRKLTGKLARELCICLINFFKFVVITVTYFEYEKLLYSYTY